MKTELIRKLRLKPGCKYVLFIPKDAGLTPSDIEQIDHRFMELGILLHTTSGIKVLEVEKGSHVA
jgi:hypothetical protein